MDICYSIDLHIHYVNNNDLQKITTNKYFYIFYISNYI